MARLKQYVEPDIDIKPDSCICRSCRDDVNKIDNPSFTPRWRKSKTASKAHCRIPGCSNAADRVTKITNRPTMCELLGAEIEYAESCYDEEATPIHYGALYKALNPINRLRKCITCGKSFTDPLKNRSCPSLSWSKSF